MKKKSENRNINLKIKNVRCFSEEQQFNIRPLTFLMGENSTGKTTIMSCFSVIRDYISDSRPRYPDFNKEPYFMGSFDDILTKKLPGDSNTFEIGCELGDDHEYTIYFTKKKERAEPVIQKIKVSLKDFMYVVDVQEKEITIKTRTKNPTNIYKEVIKDRFLYDIEDINYYLRYFIREKARSTKQDDLIKIALKMREEMSSFKSYFHNHIVSLAPIRSKPKRTYDHIKEIPDSEGSEIPVTLKRLSNESKDWKKIHEKLIRFGKASGLFSGIDVKKYGKSVGEPFQLHFQVRGVQSNMMDVGYGVSQVLPFLVRLFYPRDSRDARNLFTSYGNQFLLQQPEVHLHPKAQAELASLFVESTKDNSFLIETHSDYMIDRVSIEIRKKNISSQDVSLIYLESTKNGVKAHNMSFDEDGNLIGAPKGYRDFFTNESNRFLGFED